MKPRVPPNRDIKGLVFFKRKMKPQYTNQRKKDFFLSNFKRNFLLFLVVFSDDKGAHTSSTYQT